MRSDSKIIIALDFSSLTDARRLVDQLNPLDCHLKIGKNMFTQFGPDFVRELIQKKFSVFLDLKFHDIPKTVSEACVSAAQLGIWMLDVHVSGGRAMLLAARQAIDTLPENKRPLLIGITVLTSLDQNDLIELNMSLPLDQAVLKLALLAKDCGLDGVVCSAMEASILREKFEKDFLLITPGITLEPKNNWDQKRSLTPEIAFLNGADYLVIGRSIVNAGNPAEVLKKLNAIKIQ
ncbi:MAG: Orotidine 5'-phosphate decarboxylase [uncultured bacterium]|nr:MAG: Orotidine 5'-phosphate decarboxylase [uncultured bacterium]